MSDRAGLTLDERQEIDAFFERLRVGTHYDLLGVERDAPTDFIQHAYNARTRRFHPRSFSGQIPASYQQRLDAILAALDDARAILTDPVRRFLYDQDVASRPSPSPPPRPMGATERPRQTSSNDRTPSPSTTPAERARQSSSERLPGTARPTPPLGSLTSPQFARPEAFKPQTTPSPMRAPNVPSSDPLSPLDVGLRSAKPTPVYTEVLTPARPTPLSLQPVPEALGQRPVPAASPSQTSSDSNRTARLPTPPYGSRGAVSATPILPLQQSVASADVSQTDARVQVLEAQVSSLNGEVSTLLSEVERLAVSVQLAIAYALEPDGLRPEQLITAGQALVATRVTVAGLLARREEAAGHWEAASALWQRASKARPGEVMLLVRAAEALRRAGTDLESAENLARQAVKLDPDCAEAQAALAVIERRRKSPG